MLHVRLNGIRLSHLRSEAPFLHPPLRYRGLRLADPRDIAAMKIIALLRSLVYFEDAEDEPMPRILHKVDWPGIRARLEEEVRRWVPCWWRRAGAEVWSAI